MNEKLKTFPSNGESDPYEDRTDTVRPCCSAEHERRSGADRFDLPRVEDHVPYAGATHPDESRRDRWWRPTSRHCNC